MKATHHKPTVKQVEAINEAVRKAIGKGVAVAGTLGIRYSSSESGQPYIRYVLSDDRTCFVSNWHRGEVHVSVSEKKLDPKSFSGKKYYAKQKRAEERIAKAKARLAEKGHVIVDTFVASKANEKKHAADMKKAEGK